MTANFPNVPAMVIPPFGFALALGIFKFGLRVTLKIIEALNGEVYVIGNRHRAIDTCYSTKIYCEIIGNTQDTGPVGCVENELDRRITSC